MDVNECETLPCLHGGSCINRLGGYQCLCLPGFTADHQTVLSVPFINRIRKEIKDENSWVRDIDSNIECTLSKFANDTKPCASADLLEGRDASRGPCHTGEMDLWEPREAQQGQVQGLA
ncbi:hypothetical protein RLOC_00014269, partial [Lonchura striata]